ncbi:MAG TPA: type II secretion system protein [Gallionella sp.]|nr:type II secretion system protein [Gallionella sp.]
MKTAEQNYRLLQEIEANRRFLLTAYEQNPKLLENAELRIQQLFAATTHVEREEKRGMSAAKQRGISLVELIMFIVIVSVALAGILLVMNTVTRGSADPLIRKQALAAAESLLEEIELQDFISASGVTAAVTQANRASAYHIVSDYNTFATSGIFPVSGVAPITGLGSYNTNVTVANAALGGIAAGSAVLITVTVTDPQGNPIEISGYRTAY